MDYTESEFNKAIENGTLPIYSDATLKLIENGKMRIEKVEEHEVLAYTTAAPYLVKVLNVNNLVCVADTIFQYNDHEIKFIPDGNFDLIKEFDKTTGVENYNGIIVAKERKEKDYYYPVTTTICDQDVDQSGTSWGSRMLQGSIRIKHFDYLAANEGNEPWYYASYYIQVYTWTNLFWGWRYASATVGLTNCDWNRSYIWMGNNGVDYHYFWSVNVNTSGSSGYQHLLYEGYSNSAGINNMAFGGRVHVTWNAFADVNFWLEHNDVNVPSRWW